MSGAVARRYARALFALAKESRVLQDAAEQLGRLAAVANDQKIRLRGFFEILSFAPHVGRRSESVG